MVCRSGELATTCCKTPIFSVVCAPGCTCFSHALSLSALTPHTAVVAGCLYLLLDRGGQSSTTWKSVRLAFQPLPPGDGRGWGMLVTGGGESLWNKQRIPFCITGRLSLPGIVLFCPFRRRTFSRNRRGKQVPLHFCENRGATAQHATAHARSCGGYVKPSTHNIES